MRILRQPEVRCSASSCQETRRRTANCPGRPAASGTRNALGSVEPREGEVAIADLGRHQLRSMLQRQSLPIAQPVRMTSVYPKDHAPLEKCSLTARSDDERRAGCVVGLPPSPCADLRGSRATRPSIFPLASSPQNHARSSIIVKRSPIRDRLVQRALCTAACRSASDVKPSKRFTCLPVRSKTSVTGSKSPRLYCLEMDSDPRATV